MGKYECANIMADIKKDLKIDAVNLQKEALRLTELFTKYRERLLETRLEYRKISKQLLSLIHERRQYYTGKAKPEVYVKEPFDLRLRGTEVDDYIKVDSKVVELETEIDQIEELISLLDDTLKHITSAGFNIKNSIDFQKFLMGN